MIGIHRDFDGTAYFADPCPEPSLSQSIAKILIEQSPLHAKMAHPRLAPPPEGDEETEKYNKAQAIGNAAHSLMIGRGKKLAVIEADSFRTKIATADRDAAIERGLEPILAKHYQIASQMVEAATDQLKQIHGCERAFIEGDGEVVVVNCEEGVYGFAA
jgi:ornithine carbamoyltransferase